MFILSRIRKLYDGTSATEAAVHSDMDLVVEEGRISALRPHDPSPPPEGATVVDASRLHVTPGIIDCHGHITVTGITPAEVARSNSPESLLLVEKVLHTTLVDGGVTTQRDVGGATHLMKRLVEEGMVIGPRLKISIAMLSTTGGHADFRGPDSFFEGFSPLWPPGPGRPSSIVDGPWECRRRVRELAACGADLVKICTSPGVASPSDRLEHREFTPEEVAAITDEAEHRGLRVAAHCHSRSGIDIAIDCGVHDIQHISFMTEAQVERAAARGLTVTPTSWVLHEILQAQGLSPLVRSKAEAAAAAHATAVRHALQGDLKILAGTDPVLPGMHGRNYLELVHLVRDGARPLQAWHGATGLAAEEIGQGDTGELTRGRRADLLVWRDDVIADPERLRPEALLEVIQDGRAHRGGLPALPQRTFASQLRQVLYPERS